MNLMIAVGSVSEIGGIVAAGSGESRPKLEIQVSSPPLSSLPSSVGVVVNAEHSIAPTAMLRSRLAIRFPKIHPGSRNRCLRLSRLFQLFAASLVLQCLWLPL